MRCDCRDFELPAWAWFGVAAVGVLYLVWLGT